MRRPRSDLSRGEWLYHAIWFGAIAGVCLWGAAKTGLAGDGPLAFIYGVLGLTSGWGSHYARRHAGLDQ